MKASPLAMNMMPSVAINAGIPKSVTKLPVNSPARPQASMPTMAPSHRCPVVGESPPSDWMARAVITPEKAIKLPTERSIPAVMMTNVIPMAMMATTEICFITFSKLSRLRKLGQR